MLPRLPLSCCALQRQAASPTIQVHVYQFLSVSGISQFNNYSTRKSSNLNPAIQTDYKESSIKKTGGIAVSLKGLQVQYTPCRSKSTKLLQKNRPESDKEKEKPEKLTKSDPTTFEGQVRLSLQQKQKENADIAIQKTRKEDEKSRRRYEKEDPPEEERHKYWKSKPDRSINKALVRTDFFDNMNGRDKENFLLALELFTERDVHLRGHVEFIYAALKQMKKFGVHRDLESYKKLIDVFPKGRMIQTNMWQVEFMHYPKHQQCAVDLLEQMEDYGVIPDSETQSLLTNIFGTWSFPMRKASRMLYWMPKFKNLCPWKLPEKLPDSAMELAKLAVAQMTSVDLTTKVTTYDCAELEDASDLTWIVSGQSPQQQKLIEELPSDRPIYVEGAFRLWLKNVCMNYFILRADPKPPPPPRQQDVDPDDVGELPAILSEEYVDNALAPVPSVHEQDDGVILGICCTGSSSRDSVVSWIRLLEESNPRLGKDLSVLFTLKSPVGPTDDIEILAYRDLEELQKLGKPRDPFLVESKMKQLDLDPGMPDLRQVGVWTESESRFANWPHHFHKADSSSIKNKLENEKILDQLEREEFEQSQYQEIGGDSVSGKQIEDK